MSYWNDLLKPLVVENKLVTVLGAIIIVLSIILLMVCGRHIHHWVDVPQDNEVWTTKYNDGSSTQYILKIQNCDKCNDYRTFTLTRD